MTRLVFLDTETTGVHAERRVWDIGMISRETGREDREMQMFVDLSSLDLGNADGRALEVGRFYQRHPQILAGVAAADADLPLRVLTEEYALKWVEEFTRGAVLVGHNIAFDADVLGQRLRWWGYTPAWNYHLVEVSSLAAGWLVGQGRQVSPPPWRTNDIGEWLGLAPQPAEDAHTALGDAYRVRQVWDVVAGRPTPTEDAPVA